MWTVPYFKFLIVTENVSARKVPMQLKLFAWTSSIVNDALDDEKFH